MKKILGITIKVFGTFCLAIVFQTSFAQDKSNEQTIRFIQGVNWKQVVEKAKNENKSIFVDCYATWCVPCKKMDKEVYTNGEVINYYNTNFICYKLQMDSTKYDPESIKASYVDAAYFSNKFLVSRFPTMLFFSPDGNLLSQTEGLLEVKDLLQVGQNALDPKKNYYTLLENYNRGNRELNEIKTLAMTAYKLLKDTGLAIDFAQKYISLLPKKDFYERENIEFFHLFTRTSKDPLFRFFYQKTDTINKIMDDKLYSQSLIRSIISKEIGRPYITESIKLGVEPSWIKLIRIITAKFNSFYADFVTNAIMIDWYRYQKEWKNYATAIVRWVEFYVLPLHKKGHWPAFALNNFAWDVFRYSNSKIELSKALNWSNEAIINDPTSTWMDTYANLLYKLGERQLAIQWEEIANKLAPNDQDLVTALQKMKDNQPTWTN